MFKKQKLQLASAIVLGVSALLAAPAWAAVTESDRDGPRTRRDGGRSG